MFHVVVTRSGPEWDRAQPLDGQSPALRGDVPALAEDQEHDRAAGGLMLAQEPEEIPATAE